MTELEKYKKAFELACEYAWSSDYFGCNLPCKTDDCWGKQSCMECTQKYLLQQAEKSDTKPMTNRQWLESLSDEELAENICGCGCCIYNDIDVCRKSADTCRNAKLKWLQAEHKESDNEIQSRR